ncbi:MAG TPA: hypothetical protein PLN62_11270 [Microbacterium sp.]|nr:hypothetical protein [Microbacterium sp.]
MSAPETTTVRALAVKASPLNRSIWLWQLSLAAVIVILTLAIVVLVPTQLAEPTTAAGLALILIFTVVALIVPWDRVSRSTIAVLPFADILAIGLIALAAFSLVVAGVGAVSIVVGLVAPGDAGESLEFLRTVNSLGMLAYVVCALVTLLFIARGGTGAATGSTFAVVAADRLARAQCAGERSWALVYAQIDDAEDLRIVAGDSGFAAIAERLRGDVIEIFPTEADLGWFAPAGVAVLVAQPSAVLRERVRTAARVRGERRRRAGRYLGIVGWASVAEFGYGLDALLAAARDAAARAADAGGDRWERAVV